MKKYISRIIITLIVAFLLFYVTLPAINIHSPGFWIYLLFIFNVYLVTGLINFSTKVVNKIINNKPYYFFTIPALIIGLIIIINIINAPIFNSKKYYNRISIEENTNFLEDIKQVDFESLPLLDKDSSEKLGDRVMGSMKDLVSQFEVSNLYTQINYNNKIIRTTPLEYASILKWFNNHKEGIKGYISVNSVNGEARLTKLDKGMKYMQSALFNENLTRYLRFKYPTEIFDSENFEIDNEGNPYWVVPTIKYTGVGLKREISGVITLNPITGESNKYSTKNIPSWIDHVYNADLIIEQVNDWGKYKNGFLNSILGQKGVVATTDGYNYLLMDDDVYLYTGITSVNSDESNLGFILTNLRTKETKFYSAPGAEEYSAMDSAEGAVQQMKYKSTFPLLINLNNRPTYLLSLKDAAGLVKMYAFVDVADYQKVVVTDASKGIEKASENYLNDTNFNTNSSNTKEKDITIKSITSHVIDGITYFYIIDTNNQKYKVSIKSSDNLPFVKIGDTIKITYFVEKDIIDISKIID